MITFDGIDVATIELRLDPDPTSVRLMRAVIRRLVEFPTDDDEQSLLIAVSEVFANAVDEHLELGIDDPISVTLRFGTEGGITIADRGRGMDPDTGQKVPGTDSPDGRGLPIVRALVADVRITTDSSGTAVTLPWPERCRPATNTFAARDSEL